MVDVPAQVANVARNLRYRGVDAVRELASLVAYSLQSTTDPDPVLDADWDVLVLLDACRADLFADVAADADYDSLPAEPGSRTSPASSSVEWLETVFGGASDDALADLAYVTGNPYSASKIDHDRFHTVDEVWRYAWDDDLGTIPPRPVTDAAIRTGRESTADRMVVHYMQPHFPSVVEREQRSEGVELDEFGDDEMSVWDDLRFGHRSEADAWKSYRQNLEYVLDDLALLFENLDAERVVVTADHGNAFGEHHVYGHPGGVDLPVLREVPWWETTTTDTYSHDPDAAGRDDTGEGGDVIEERLEDLGYRT
ncbi:alkaline phosphatase family protein [Halobacterium noricense]|uniref:hypothetical protein n=1 Tax=Halobacterium noricense TaxID=223182 RepID=UPI001E5D5B41|nr:hypothetical protein [Halobacterium noricense]UHH24302.1 hypothetical protein LT974_09910 [Halobacterium noricense]